MAAWPCKINYHHTTRGWDTQFIEEDIYCLVLMKHQVNIVWNIVPLGSCQLYCTCRKKESKWKRNIFAFSLFVFSLNCLFPLVCCPFCILFSLYFISIVFVFGEFVFYCVCMLSCLHFFKCTYFCHVCILFFLFCILFRLYFVSIQAGGSKILKQGEATLSS